MEQSRQGERTGQVDVERDQNEGKERACPDEKLRLIGGGLGFAGPLGLGGCLPQLVVVVALVSGAQGMACI